MSIVFFYNFILHNVINLRKKVVQLRHYFWVYSILVLVFSFLFFIIFFILQYGTALYGNYSRMVGNRAIFTVYTIFNNLNVLT